MGFACRTSKAYTRWTRTSYLTKEVYYYIKNPTINCKTFLFFHSHNMKSFIYKIQWLIHWFKDLEQIINILWVRSLDKINVRTAYDYKIIDTYTDNICWSTWEAEEKTMEYFHSKELEYEKHWNYLFELVRK